MSFIGRIVKFMVLLFILCTAGYFIMYNGTTIDVSFGHFGVMPVPAAVAYIVSFFFGAAVVAAVFGYEFTRLTIKVSRLKRQIAKLEKSEANYYRDEKQNSNQSRMSSMP